MTIVQSFGEAIEEVFSATFNVQCLMLVGSPVGKAPDMIDLVEEASKLAKDFKEKRTRYRTKLRGRKRDQKVSKKALAEEPVSKRPVGLNFAAVAEPCQKNPVSAEVAELRKENLGKAVEGATEYLGTRRQSW